MKQSKINVNKGKMCWYGLYETAIVKVNLQPSKTRLNNTTAQSKNEQRYIHNSTLTQQQYTNPAKSSRASSKSRDLTANNLLKADECKR